MYAAVEAKGGAEVLSQGRAAREFKIQAGTRACNGPTKRSGPLRNSRIQVGHSRYSSPPCKHVHMRLEYTTVSAHLRGQAEEARLVLARLALEHLPRALRARVLHHGGEVAVGPPSADEGLDVYLVDGRRVERDPRCLLEVEVAERRAQRGPYLKYRKHLACAYERPSASRPCHSARFALTCHFSCSP